MAKIIFQNANTFFVESQFAPLKWYVQKFDKLETPLINKTDNRLDAIHKQDFPDSSSLGRSLR